MDAREQRVYDENRNVVWPEDLDPGQVALFHVDAKNGRYRTERGLRIDDFWARTRGRKLCRALARIETDTEFKAAERNLTGISIARLFWQAGD